MTDIVERLRAYPGPADSLTELIRNIIEQRHEAADELERLRAEVKRLKGVVGAPIFPMPGTWCRALEQKAENERLRTVVNEQAAAITAAIRTIERQQAELVDMRRALKL